MKKYLILSPYATHGTQNSGDDLIIGSLIELLNHHAKGKIEYKVISIANSTPRKEITYNNINIKNYNALLVPGFRVTIDGDKILDIRLRYIERAILYNIPVFCIGSSWCVYPGIIEQTKYKINPREKALLKYIVRDDKNCLNTRDTYTKEFLYNNGIKCDCIGDLALYDVSKFGYMFDCNKINKIAISLPHNQYHYAYCTILKDEIEKIFGIHVDLATHQYLKDKSKIKNLVDLSGEYKNLEKYNNYDMHIGFRLHGHLWFLRNRKPSILIAEDGRGWGHLNTLDSIGIHAAQMSIIHEARKMNQYELLAKRFDRNTRVDIDYVMRALKELLSDKSFMETSYNYVSHSIDYIYNNAIQNIISKILEV